MEISDSILNFLTHEKQPSRELFQSYTNYYYKILNSIRKPNRLIDILMFFLIFYVNFHHTIALNLSFSKLSFIDNNQLRPDELADHFTNFVKAFSFLDFFSYIDSTSTTQKTILFYVVNSTVLLYYLLIPLVGLINCSNKVMKFFLYVHIMLNKVLAIPVLKINFIYVVEFVKYLTDESWNSTNVTLFPLLSIISFLSLLLNIFLITKTNLQYNDLRLFKRSIPYGEYSIYKKISFSAYIICTSLVSAIATVVTYSNRTNSSFFNELLIQSIPYLCLLKLCLITVYIGFDVIYPFFIETSYKYWRVLDNSYYLVFDFISSFPIVLLILFYTKFTYLINFPSIILIIVMTLIANILIIMVINERELHIMKTDVSSITNANYAMCFSILMWNLLTKKRSDNKLNWLINYQVDLHKIKCFEHDCICTNIQSVDVSNLKLQLKNINLDVNLTENYFNRQDSQKQTQVELIKVLRFDSSNITNEFSERNAKIIYDQMLYQQLYFILISTLNSNIPKNNSYFIFIQASMLIYLSKCYFQGIQKCMVFEHNIEYGFQLVKSQYNTFKDSLFNHIGNQLFVKEDTMNIKKLAKFEKHYDRLLVQVAKAFKSYSRMIKLFNKNEVKDGDMYKQAYDLIIDLEDIQENFNIINSLISNEIKALKLMCYINISIIDSIDVAHYSYNQMISSLNNKVSLSSKNNAYFADNSNPGILCFSGNLNNLATITYCNQQFHKLLYQEDKSLIGTNVNNIMHELFARYHDYFIISFYKTNKIHNINKDNVVFAHSSKNLLIPLRQLVKVLPTLDDGIFYIGYDLDYKVGSRKSEAYLLFSPENGFIYSFDLAFKTLFNLNPDNICINSNNHSDILNINHIFKDITVKMKKKEILDNIEFELIINLKQISDQLEDNNTSEEMKLLFDPELKKIVDTLKPLNKSYTCIASISKISISNGLIKFGIMKLKLNGIFFTYNKITNKTEVMLDRSFSNNNDTVISGSIPKPSFEITSGIKGNKDIKLKEYFNKLNKLSTLTNDSSLPKLSKIDLIINLLCVIVFFSYIGIFVKEIVNYNTSLNTLIDQQNNIYEVWDICLSLPFYIQSLYKIKYSNEILNSECYIDKQIVIQNYLKTRFLQVFQIVDNLSETDTSANSNSYFYYQLNFDSLRNISDITKASFEKIKQSPKNLLKLPLSDMDKIFSDILDLQVDTNNLLYKKMLFTTWNINMEVNKFIKDKTESNKVELSSFFDSNNNQVILITIMICVSTLILFTAKIYLFFLQKKQQNILVQSICLSKDELINNAKIAQKIENYIKSVEANSTNLEQVEILINKESNKVDLSHSNSNISFRGVDKVSINKNIQLSNNETNLKDAKIKKKSKLIKNKEESELNQLKPKSVLKEQIKQNKDSLSKNNNKEEISSPSPKKSDISQEKNKKKSAFSIDPSPIINNENDKINETNVNTPLKNNDDEVQPIVIKYTLSLPKKIFSSILLGLMILISLLVITMYLYLDKIFIIQNSLKNKNNIQNYVDYAKQSLNYKYLQKNGVNISKNTTDVYINNLTNQRLILLNDFAELTQYSQLTTLKQVLNAIFQRNSLCTFYNNTCCNYQHGIDKGYFNYMMMIEDFIIYNQYKVIFESILDISLIFIGDYEDNIHESLVKETYDALNGLYHIFNLKITFFIIWMIFMFTLFFYNYKVFKKQIQRNEKIISLLPKKSIGGNLKVISILKEF